MSQISIPVSFGELVDKITILQIKLKRINDKLKYKNISNELNLLEEIWEQTSVKIVDISAEQAELKEVNEKLWSIEDNIRRKEKQKQFDGDFISLVRSVYKENDKRAQIKKRINELLGSELTEEKYYVSYSPAQG